MTYCFLRYSPIRIATFLLIFVSACPVLTGCGSASQTKVVIRIRSGHGQKLYISKVPTEQEKWRILDSAVVEDRTQDLVFVISEQEEALYQLSFAGSGVKFIFINDVPEIMITGNFITGRFQTEQSPASQILKRYLDHQTELAGKTRLRADQIREAAGAHSSRQVIDSLTNQLNIALSDLSKSQRAFADTVSSAAAFMLAYNSLEFGADYAGQAKFITDAANRFPNSQDISHLKEEVLSYIKVMQEEFQVGDLLPAITLPDQNGQLFSTASLKGKYYLIDFWSSWCPQCLAFGRAKQQVRKLFPGSQFAMVSVAIDAEKEDWQKAIRETQTDWPQLIDTMMWLGPAIRTLKFDSIPFNFLVDPRGRIIRKAIPPDSLSEAVGNAIQSDHKPL